MAVAGFKIAVNHCIRLFQNVPIALYTDIPMAHINCIPEESGRTTIKGLPIETSDFADTLDTCIKQFLNHIGAENSNFRFEIKILPHSHLTIEFLPISILTSICAILNEWLHNPIEKNDLLTWLIENNNYQDEDIISACIYGGIMSHVGTRPFRIYQPKGLFFHIETISESEAKPLPSLLIPLIILAIERSDFNSIHDLLANMHAVGNIEESYLGVIDLPDLKSRLHIHNISTPDMPKLNLSNLLSPIFGIKSSGCSII